LCLSCKQCSRHDRFIVRQNESELGGSDQSASKSNDPLSYLICMCFRILAYPEVAKSHVRQSFWRKTAFATKQYSGGNIMVCFFSIHFYDHFGENPLLPPNTKQYSRGKIKVSHFLIHFHGVFTRFNTSSHGLVLPSLDIFLSLHVSTSAREGGVGFATCLISFRGLQVPNQTDRPGRSKLKLSPNRPTGQADENSS
jgi:hypothetical protein